MKARRVSMRLGLIDPYEIARHCEQLPTGRLFVWIRPLSDVFYAIFPASTGSPELTCYDGSLNFTAPPDSEQPP